MRMNAHGPDETLSLIGSAHMQNDPYLTGNKAYIFHGISLKYHHIW